MGNTHGHISRAFGVATRLTEHQFHFVGGGRVPEVVRDRFPVLPVPVASTVYRRQRSLILPTCGHLARCVAGIPTVRRQILDLIERWQPHVAICDREFFTPHAAAQAGLPMFGLDHSHVLQVCRCHVPAAQTVSWSLSRIEDFLFFDHTRHNLVVSFFHPPLRRRGRNELLPPILREAARGVRPTQGGHVFIYQSTPTFHALIRVARQLKRSAIVYGYRNEHATDGNLTFKPFDPRGILEDLAGCAYVIANGGHNLISEALHFGKPMFCFPVAINFEQFLNSYYVRELGYGDFSTSFAPTLSMFQQLESRLDDCRRAIANGFTDGTEQVLQRVREVIAEYAA
jgi:uncharacterized protein (TIGR00661 family)